MDRGYIRRSGIFVRTRAAIIAAIAIPVLAGGACATHPPAAKASPAAVAHPVERPTYDADGLPNVDDHFDNKIEKWKVVGDRPFLASTRCTNAPLEVRLPVVDSQWARTVSVMVRSPRPLVLSVDIMDEQGHTIAESRLFNAEDGPERRAALAALEHCRADAPAEPPGEGPVATVAAPKPERAARVRGGGRHRHVPAARPGMAVPPPTRSRDWLPRSSEAHPSFGLTQVSLDDVGRLNQRVNYTNAYDLSWLLLPKHFARLPPGELPRYQAIHEHSDRALVVRLWSQEVMDLADVRIVVVDETLEPVIDVTRFAKLMARREAVEVKADKDWAAHCAAHLDDKTCPERNSLPLAAGSPPPAPQVEKVPRRPSADDEWIPGSWRWDGKKYVWDGGAWHKMEALPVSAPVVAGSPPPAPVKPPAPNPPARVAVIPPAPAKIVSPPPPPPTIEVQSPPPAPPPAIGEQAPPAPAQAGTIWIAGFWRWDGRGYRWVPGRWQVPPTATARWRPPGWRAQAGVRFFFPGGWIDLPR